MNDVDHKTDTVMQLGWADLSGTQQQSTLTVFGYAALDWDNGNIESKTSQAIKSCSGGHRGQNGGTDDNYCMPPVWRGAMKMVGSPSIKLSTLYCNVHFDCDC